MATGKALSPWNPTEAVEVSPTEYEWQVAAWLRETDGAFKSLRVEHQVKITGSSGEYAFDAIAEFEIFGGASILVLLECKRHSRPVERDHLLVLEAKLCDVGAQKAMIFSTGGFQRGAIEYAAKRGIAAITLIDGKSTYVTRSATVSADPPPWVPRFSGWYFSLEGGSIHASLVSEGRIDALAEWISGILCRFG